MPWKLKSQALHGTSYHLIFIIHKLIYFFRISYLHSYYIIPSYTAHKSLYKKTILGAITYSTNIMPLQSILMQILSFY